MQVAAALSEVKDVQPLLWTAGLQAFVGGRRSGGCGIIGDFLFR